MAHTPDDKRGFTLGNHTFLHPSVNGPMSRHTAPKRQILGAPPPAYLEGLVREATKQSPAAKELLRGKFCGHSEPTMTVFDVVIDGTDMLEVSGIPDAEDEERNVQLLACRVPGGRWVPLFRNTWEELQQTLEGVTPEPVSESEAEQLEVAMMVGRVSIGFEYPCDATSRDTVTWLTVDVLFDGQKKPQCVVDAEMA